MNQRSEVCNLAGNIQDALIEFVRKANQFDIGCMSRNIEVDGYSLVFHDEKTWQKFVDVFDVLGIDFSTGEFDEKYKTLWYIDFEFSNGISE